jgi:hypothetical protein
MDTSYIAKDARRCCSEEGSEGRRVRNGKLKYRESLLCVWTRLPNLYTTWMGPLVGVTYIGLTQSVFRLDRVKSNSCDFPERIHADVDSSAS